ncbi:ABC transporter permease [Pseudarthrobacter sp. AL20]|uniref:ABC transporter permease n=1 Tax=Pseudarthrobacter sp. AL20 TaxID=3042239 RepID=UPI002499D879|nr:ABC transporter permease [Pseudarthrobacter sp. AL20]MDI3193859.1 ABC transporter permease [Pseudarthrobacter sp. AL20]
MITSDGAQSSRATTPERTDGPRSRPSPSPRPKAGSKLSRRGALALNVAAVSAGIGLWWLVSVLGVLGLPGPVEVVQRGAELIADGILGGDVAASLSRVLTGFLLGSAVAIPVGFLMGWYPVCRALFEPYVQFFRTIPPLALIPLAIVILGIEETPKIFVIFMASFLSCVIATFQGVIGVEKTLINAARVLGAPSFVVFARVVIPASSPFILVGMRIGLGASWATVVAAELIAAQQGLGFRMQQAQIFYDLPTIFVGVISIGILGLLMDRILLFIESKLTGWQERR